MLIRIPAAFPRMGLPRLGLPRMGTAFAAGLLALAGSGCLTKPPERPAPPPPSSQPAAAAPAPPQPPSVVPASASVPGRLKIALVSAWLWVDGEYVSPVAQIDYLKLLAHVRDHRVAAGDSVEAKTLELEVDAAPDWQTLHYVLGLCDGYERLELITGARRYSLRLEISGSSTIPERAKGRRTALLLRRDHIAVWAGQDVPADAAESASPKLEKLFESPRSSSDGELEAGLRRVCSKDARCSRLSIHFEEDLPGQQLLRVLESFERAAGPGVAPPALSVNRSAPPPGEEARVFTAPDAISGRLSPHVIRQVVRASYAVFRGCYERGLWVNPKLEGRVTVRFVIQRDGSVSDVINGGSDLPSDEVIECVIESFSSLRFPPPVGGIVTVQYPIMLQPG
jgi:hypothetical protein